MIKKYFVYTEDLSTGQIVRALENAVDEETKIFRGVFECEEEWKDYLGWNGAKKTIVLDHCRKRLDDEKLAAQKWNEYVAEENAKREALIAEMETADYWQKKHKERAKELFEEKINAVINMEILDLDNLDAEGNPTVVGYDAYDGDSEAFLDLDALLESNNRLDTDIVTWRLADNTYKDNPVSELKKIRNALRKRRYENREILHQIKDEIDGNNLTELKAYNVDTRYAELETA